MRPPGRDCAVFVSFLLCFIFPFSDAACDFNTLSSLTGKPSGLEHNVTVNVEVGDQALYECTQDNFYLDPDTLDNGKFGVVCNWDDSFIQPTSWPDCVAKCTPPAAVADGYHPVPVDTPKTKAGEFLNVACNDPSALVAGIDQKEYPLECGASGTWPTAAWPSCVPSCQIPSPLEDGYKYTGGLSHVASGSDVTFSCDDDTMKVEDTNSADLVLPCKSDGSFEVGWPKCIVQCGQPDVAGSSYKLPADAPLVTKAGMLATIECSTDLETVLDTGSRTTMISCNSTGMFPDKADWPACNLRCPVPKAADGFKDLSPTTKPLEADEMVSFDCKKSTDTVGDTGLRYVNGTCDAATAKVVVDWKPCNVRCVDPVAEAGYDNLTGVTPVAVGAKLNFSCTEAGAKVGMTHHNIQKVECLPDGNFESGWPNCTVRCVPPLGGEGYNSQPAGTPTVPKGEKLRYDCQEKGYLSGQSGKTYNELTCGDDGTFPATWPVCAPGCLVPLNPTGFVEQDGSVGNSVDEGVELTWTCTDGTAEIGDVMASSLVMKCVYDGGAAKWSPDTLPPCEVPKECVAPVPPPATDSNLTAGAVPIKAYRSLEYTCEDGFTTPNGPTFSVKCLDDGTWDSVAEWPVCRELSNCTAGIPVPPESTQIANSTSDEPTKEGNTVVYKCLNETEHKFGNGEAAFTLTCGQTGDFGTFSWPNCSSPEAVFEEPDDGCQCLGNVNVTKEQAGNILEVCRMVSLDKISGTSTPASRVRCGSTKPDNVTRENLCYCDSPLEQSALTFEYKMMLTSAPWQWYVDNAVNDGYNELKDPRSEKYRSIKEGLEKVIDTAALDDATMTDFIRATLERFQPGKEVPLGVFSAIKPTTPKPTEAPVANDTVVAAKCTQAMLDALSLPAHMVRKDSGEVAAGESAKYGCAGATERLFLADGKLAQATFACKADVSGFDSPYTDTFPVCTAIAATCAVPTIDVAKGYTALPGSATDAAVDGTFVLNCDTSGHIVAGSDATSLTLTCAVVSAAADPWYEVKLDQDVTAIAGCEAPPAVARKRRAAEETVPSSGYNYTEAVFSLQFLNEDSVAAAAVQTFADGLGDATSGNLTDEAGVTINNECPIETCVVIEPTLTCSNFFFEKLPTGYKALTPIGYYQSPGNDTLVNSGNLLTVGEVAELRCVRTDPKQVPLVDDQDQDSKDRKLTVTCQAPMEEGGIPSWSLTAVPPCASICSQSLPAASVRSDLQLIAVVPAANTSLRLDVDTMNMTENFLYTGDRLLYKCKTDYWGVYGGRDNEHSGFGCTEDGVLNTPLGEDKDDPWPRCMPQQDMVINGVELMLDRFDQRISDRYKLIDFQEEDNKELIKSSTNWFLEMTVPVICGLAAFIALWCCCARKGSPICSLCEAREQTKMA